MPNGGSVTDHVLYMIEMIERLGKLGCPLHEQLGKDAILNSLPSSYLDFLDHFRMNKPAVNYHGLLGLLQTFEKDHHLNKGVVNLVGGSGDSRPFRKGIKKKKGKKVQSASGSSQTRKVKADQSGAECFYCKKKGHWKRNYFLYQASLDPNKQKKRKQQSTAEQGIYMINSCNFSTTDWVWILVVRFMFAIHCRDYKLVEDSMTGNSF